MSTYTNHKSTPRGAECTITSFWKFNSITLGPTKAVTKVSNYRLLSWEMDGLAPLDLSPSTPHSTPFQKLSKDLKAKKTKRETEDQGSQGLPREVAEAVDHT